MPLRKFLNDLQKASSTRDFENGKQSALHVLTELSKSREHQRDFVTAVSQLIDCYVITNAKQPQRPEFIVDIAVAFSEHLANELIRQLCDRLTAIAAMQQQPPNSHLPAMKYAAQRCETTCSTLELILRIVSRGPWWNNLVLTRLLDVFKNLIADTSLTVEIYVCMIYIVSICVPYSIPNLDEKKMKALCHMATTLLNRLFSGSIRSISPQFSNDAVKAATMQLVLILYGIIPITFIQELVGHCRNDASDFVVSQLRLHPALNSHLFQLKQALTANQQPAAAAQPTTSAARTNAHNESQNGEKNALGGDVIALAECQSKQRFRGKEPSDIVTECLNYEATSPPRQYSADVFLASAIDRQTSGDKEPQPSSKIDEQPQQCKEVAVIFDQKRQSQRISSIVAGNPDWFHTKSSSTNSASVELNGNNDNSDILADLENDAELNNQTNEDEADDENNDNENKDNDDDGEDDDFNKDMSAYYSCPPTSASSTKLLMEFLSKKHQRQQQQQQRHKKKLAKKQISHEEEPQLSPTSVSQKSNSLPQTPLKPTANDVDEFSNFSTTTTINNKQATQQTSAAQRSLAALNESIREKLSEHAASHHRRSASNAGVDNDASSNADSFVSSQFLRTYLNLQQLKTSSGLLQNENNQDEQSSAMVALLREQLKLALLSLAFERHRQLIFVAKNRSLMTQLVEKGHLEGHIAELQRRIFELEMALRDLENERKVLLAEQQQTSRSSVPVNSLLSVNTNHDGNHLHHVGLLADLSPRYRLNSKSASDKQGQISSALTLATNAANAIGSLPEVSATTTTAADEQPLTKRESASQLPLASVLPRAQSSSEFPEGAAITLQKEVRKAALTSGGGSSSNLATVDHGAHGLHALTSGASGAIVSVPRREWDELQKQRDDLQQELGVLRQQLRQVQLEAISVLQQKQMTQSDSQLQVGSSDQPTKLNKDDNGDDKSAAASNGSLEAEKIELLTQQLNDSRREVTALGEVMNEMKQRLDVAEADRRRLAAELSRLSSNPSLALKSSHSSFILSQQQQPQPFNDLFNNSSALIASMTSAGGGNQQQQSATNQRLESYPTLKRQVEKILLKKQEIAIAKD